MSRQFQIFLIFILIAGFVLFAGCTSRPPDSYNPPTQLPVSIDLTNQNSPEAGTFSAYPALTKLHSPDMPVGL